MLYLDVFLVSHRNAGTDGCGGFFCWFFFIELTGEGYALTEDNVFEI